MDTIKGLKITHQQTTLVDQVESNLLDYFKSMELKPGDAIPKEQELASALGVGRSVLREALSRLRMLGFIDSRTKRGMILTEPSLFGGMRRVIEPQMLGEGVLFELLGLRISLEVGICDLVINNLTDRHIEELEVIVSRGKVANFGEYSPDSEFEFHTKLFEITGNRTIAEFQELIHPVSVFIKDRFRDYFLPVNMELERAGKRITHRDLFTYLKDRDRKGFCQAMRNHFAPYYDFLNQKNHKD